MAGVAEISLLSDGDDDDVFDDNLTQLLQDQQTRSKNNAKANTSLTPHQEHADPDHLLSEPAVPTYRVNDSELSTFIYPVNFPKRAYQYTIVQSAIWNNTLVALPTGLGKTFIAATIILNHTRWFPDSTILFMAPTRPLVAQQIKACCGIMGISQDRIGIMLDKLIRNRGQVWADKQIIFTTPQIVENDLNKIDVYRISLVVVDEAHRTKGNYSYNKVCSLLMDKFRHYKFRVLALTATPGSNLDDIQSIIDSLHISRIEIKSEESKDIKPYIKQKTLEKIQVPVSEEINTCIMLLGSAIEPTLKMANSRGIYDNTQPERINFFQCLEIQQSIIRNPSIAENLKWSNYFLLQLLCVVGQCLRRLNIYGIHSFYQYFSEKRNEFLTKWNMKKAKNKQAHLFYSHPQVTQLMKYVEDLLQKPNFIPHPKLQVLIDELKEFKRTQLGKVIVFAEFRETALNIVTHLEKLGDSLIRPHIFIGQAREKDKFTEEGYKAHLKRLKKKSTAAPPKRKGRKRKHSENSDDSDNEANTTNGRTSSEDAQLKGMNQALQREIIKKFKDDVYNILVCTSIGEEGLDIGEVDLIVCYDSTSSPIKNIQRMGRTGRKRDGRVLLLFSLNEQSKFEKALNDYSNIQKLVMEDHRLQLHPAMNLLPRGIRPRMVDRVLEIPKENIQLKLEDDDDEIIKMATQYMKDHMKNSPKNKRKKPTKTQPQFFLPQGVDTRFTSASNLVKPVSPESNEKAPKPPSESSGVDHSILGLLVDSDFSSSDNEQQANSREAVHTELTNNHREPLQENDDKENSFNEGNRSQAKKSSSGIMEQIKSQQENQGIYNQMAPVYGGPQSNMASTKRFLGIKRTRVTGTEPHTGTIIDQLKKQKKREPGSNDVINIDGLDEEWNDDDIWVNPPSSSPLKQKTTRSNKVAFIEAEPEVEEDASDANIFNSTQEPFSTNTDPIAQSTQIVPLQLKGNDEEDVDDIFNDDLEGELGLTEHIKQEDLNEDPVYELDPSSNNGIINEAQTLELYTDYFCRPDPSEYVVPFHDGSYSSKSGVIGHATHSNRVLRFLHSTTK